MQPVDVKLSTYIDLNIENNKKDNKFKISDIVRISKYKSIFARGYTLNQSEEDFVVKKVKNIVQCTYFMNDLNGEEIVGTFYENYLQKINQEEFRIKKVINKKGDNVLFKWKG